MKTAEQIAMEIATDLFTNGGGEKADRLVMIQHSETDIGGWSQRAVEDRVADILRRHLE